MKLAYLLLFMAAHAYGIEKEKIYEIKDCKVTFSTTSSPDLVNIEGKGGVCSGRITSSKELLSGSIKGTLGAFDTGIELRNKHLREKFLEVAKYPTAELVIKDQKDDGEIEGSLKIKKDTKPVKIKYEVKDGVGKASFKIEIKNYPSIGVPSWLGVTAANSVDISVEFKY